MNLAEFRRKNDAQFQRQWDWLHSLGLHFIGAVSENLVKTTPGFGLQSPDDTEYIPTGRLRGGWNLTRDPIDRSSKGLYADRTQEGPFSDYGTETIARIAGQAAEIQGAFGILHLENDVGYGEIVRLGLGRHAAVGPRNWPYDTSLKMATFRSMALSRASGR